MITGTAASPGIAWGKIFVISQNKVNLEGNDTGGRVEPEKEIEKFKKAVGMSLEELESLSRETREKLGDNESRIFYAQILVLKDSEMINSLAEYIREKTQAAGEALKCYLREINQNFRETTDDVTREKLAITRDAVSRLLKNTQFLDTELLDELEEPVIIVARELSPAQAARLEKGKILALVTESGGINSHASIIARSLEIPALVGVKDIVTTARNSTIIIVDCYSERIFLDPEPEMLKKYADIKRENESSTPEKSTCPAVTGDGIKIHIYANLGRLQELETLKEHDSDGIGILRSEFLVMDRQSPPTSGDFESGYRKILDFMMPKPVIIRLLDVGGDKSFPFLSYPSEHNPSLGRRGVRLLLDNRELLKTQIRGILEANKHGNARIIIPMVTVIEEIREVTSIIRETEMEMVREGKEVLTHVPVGIMIETPSAALLSLEFSREVDFFSIGTNDLTQYTLASDRESEHVQHLYNYFNPSVLRLINLCRESAEKTGIEISICGEMAMDLRALPILMGLGLKKFSVGIGKIEKVRDLICRIDLSEAALSAEKVLGSSNSSEVEKIADDQLHRFTSSNS
jgi:phosphoenolpyruvate-protein phosphotransferase (PTS system enzyme I)